jgi:L-histidine Nalpha-methyltransferase
VTATTLDQHVPHPPVGAGAPTLASDAAQHWLQHLARDAAAGLAATPKTLPSKYFYDARGSELFEQITRLPEYYQTRAETTILEAVAGDIVATVGPETIVELGSGSSRKTRLLLDAMRQASSGETYVPFDVSADALATAAERLTRERPWLQVLPVVGDFERDLDRLPRHGRTLIAFLGSTIGNLHPHEQPAFLRQLTASCQPGDAVVVGFDLVKDRMTLEAAYNDTAGVTAQFNRNILCVLNRELHGTVPVDAFQHVARYNDAEGWIEMALRAIRVVTATLTDADTGTAITVHLDAGEEIRTEISCKYTRGQVERLVASAGLRLDRWDTDPRGLFAVATASLPDRGNGCSP